MTTHPWYLVAESDDIDTRYTDEIVCPHCGHEQGDSWEWADSDDDAECDHCENRFGYTRDISVSYTSSATDEQKAAAVSGVAEVPR